MVWIKLESIYTETDRYGNQRRFENRFEANGSNSEVYMIMQELIKHTQLPGTSPIQFPRQIKELLMSE